MSNDKSDATFHNGHDLPQREPFETLASFDRAPEVRLETGQEPYGLADPERPWASPGTPPWAGTFHDPATPKHAGLPIWAWMLIALGLVVASCAGMIAFGTTQPDRTITLNDPAPVASGEAVADVPAAPTGPASYAVGKTFRSGDFQYTIHGVKTGLAKVGDDNWPEKAQGAFTRLDVTIKNVSTGPIWFDANARIKTEDSAGRRFSSDDGANIFGNENGHGLITEVNPGNAVRAFIFFDLPKGIEAKRAVISAGVFTFEEDAVVLLR